MINTKRLELGYVSWNLGNPLKWEATFSVIQVLCLIHSLRRTGPRVSIIDRHSLKTQLKQTEFRNDKSEGRRPRVPSTHVKDNVKEKGRTWREGKTVTSKLVRLERETISRVLVYTHLSRKQWYNVTYQLELSPRQERN